MSESQQPGQSVTYAAAGVDVEAGDRAVELMKAAVSRTHGPEVLGGVGGFAGMFDASALKDYTKPLLATSTDGVGTKIAIARAMDIHDTIGRDLVAMVVDDLVVVGAKPLFMTDYIACGKVVPERIAHIVAGIAAGCAEAGCALVGGETAEHPGLMAADEYDVAGAATGVVDEPQLLGPARVRNGDVAIAMASSGLHSNGFSLVRAVVDHAGWSLQDHRPEFARTLGEELLEPTRIYAQDILALMALGEDLHSVSHVTGGGLAANVARVLPAGLMATLDRSTWQPPAVFQVLSAAGGVPVEDQERTFNLGVGMVAFVSASAQNRALASLEQRGVPAWVLGTVGADDLGATDRVSGTKGVEGGAARLVGEHSR